MVVGLHEEYLKGYGGLNVLEIWKPGKIQDDQERNCKDQHIIGSSLEME